MWRDLSNWEDIGWEAFPTVRANTRPRHYTNRFEAVVNRYAERVLAIVMAGAPCFYVALFLAYLAVCLGIIS